MKVVDGILVLEHKNCYCQTGMVPNWIDETCPDCHGSKKNPKDKRRKCKTCSKNAYGRATGIVSVQHGVKTCPRCQGNPVDFEMENYTDYTSVHLDLPWSVVRSGREMSWAEQHLGHGLGSCVDYGRHKNLTDDELIAKEKESLKRTQGCKLVRSKEDMRLCDGIVIVTADHGYSTIARFEDA